MRDLHNGNTVVASDTRLSREQWLSQALEILAREGNAKLRVDTICKALGVTKGSFYWHFKNREDFVVSLVDYWKTAFTDVVIEHVRNLGEDPKSRLFAVAEAVSRNKLARYDVCIRAWAAQDPVVAEKVLEVDETRLSFSRSLFGGMGFKGHDLEMRTRAFVGYLSFEPAVFSKSSDEDAAEMVKLFRALIIRP